MSSEFRARAVAFGDRPPYENLPISSPNLSVISESNADDDFDHDAVFAGLVEQNDEPLGDADPAETVRVLGASPKRRFVDPRVSSSPLKSPKASSSIHGKSQDVTLLRVSPRKEAVNHEGRKAMGEVAASIPGLASPEGSGLGVPGDHGDENPVTLRRVTSRKESAFDQNSVPRKDYATPSDGSSSENGGPVTLLRITPRKDSVVEENLAPTTSGNVSAQSAAVEGPLPVDEVAESVTLLRVTPLEALQYPENGNRLIVFDEKKNQFGLNPETGALSKIRSSGASTSVPAAAVTSPPTSVSTSLPAGQRDFVSVNVDYPERITSERACGLVECCCCNPFAWCAYCFSVKAENHRVAAVKLERREAEKDSLFQAAWWGSFSVDCGFLAFAFNVVIFLLFFLAIVVFFLHKCGVTFFLVTRWGKGADADFDILQLGD